MYIKIGKRIIDLVVALIALPFWIFIVIVIGPIIYFQDKGSIFYNAPRLGKDGTVFKMFKFRSMKVNSPDLRNTDGSTFNAENDSRLTKIGKFIRKTSIDETPQILNIIKGEMSIIGPRPDLPEHYDLYENDEKRKLAVKPGVTGYNQAYFRNNVPWKERIKNDLYYIDNISFWMDIKIVFKTVESVFTKKDIFVNSDNQNIKTNKNN